MKLDAHRSEVWPTLLAFGRQLSLTHNAAKRRQSCSDVPPAVQAGAGAQRYARIRANSENTGKGVLFFAIPCVPKMVRIADCQAECDEVLFPDFSIIKLTIFKIFKIFHITSSLSSELPRKHAVC